MSVLSYTTQASLEDFHTASPNRGSHYCGPYSRKPRAQSVGKSGSEDPRSAVMSCSGSLGGHNDGMSAHLRPHQRLLQPALHLGTHEGHQPGSALPLCGFFVPCSLEGRASKRPKSFASTSRLPQGLLISIRHSAAGLLEYCDHSEMKVKVGVWKDLTIPSSSGISPECWQITGSHLKEALNWQRGVDRCAAFWKEVGHICLR